MMLKLIGTAADIADAIDQFPYKFHEGFQAICPLSAAYTADPMPSWEICFNLAMVLRQVLREWRAGQRAAPAVKSERELARALHAPALHARLARLSRNSLADLGIMGAQRMLNCPSLSLAEWDQLLLDTLQAISAGMFVGNNNLTYPMKTLLLITFLSPAFDSQVRDGAGHAGFSGMSARQNIQLPADTRHAAGLKLTRFPFILGQCWRMNAAVLEQGIRASRYAWLLDYPGRVFDVLLFMQGSDPACRILRLETATKNWYRMQ